MVRARRIARHTMLGRRRSEICAVEGLTLAEFHSARKWLGQIWSSNPAAFDDYLLGERARLEELQKLIDAVLTDQRCSAADKGRVAGKLLRIGHEIINDTYLMALRLGVLDREVVKVAESQTVTVSFGDENIIPWFNMKNATPEKTT